jgi:hypothetical protein
VLEDAPDMPATVLAVWVGWTGSIRWFSENAKRLRPKYRPVGSADRIVGSPGDAAQCDVWFPPRKIPLEECKINLLPVLVITRPICGRRHRTTTESGLLSTQSAAR